MKVKELKDFKNNLYSSLSRDLSGFEKNFLLISGGILAFSITFIKEIVKIEHATCLPCLYISWFLIIVAIGIMMYTFMFSAKSSDNLWKLTDDLIIQHRLYDEDILLTPDQCELFKSGINTMFYSDKRVLRNMRYSAITAFIIGIGFLSYYVGVNLTRENQQYKTTSQAASKSIQKDTIKIITDRETHLIILGNEKSNLYKTKDEDRTATTAPTTRSNSITR